jgi:hypothetical protein
VQNASSERLRPRIIWLMVAGVVAILLVAGTYNAVALPGCRSCHNTNGLIAATKTSPHASVDCRACHVPAGRLNRVSFGFRQTFHMFIPLTDGAARDASAVPDSRCLACHAKVESSVVSANGIRIAHETCDKGASCTDCHSATAHGKATSWVRTYDMDRCLECHVTKAQTACNLCHEGRSTAERIVTGTFAVTHGPKWQETHGMGNPATCTVCHTSNDCASCHGSGVPHDSKFIEKHAAAAADKNAKCSTCHATTFCESCHGTPMPHGPTFIRDHAKSAAAQPQLCKRCHADSDCTRCHETHVHPGGAIGGRQKGSGN